MRAPLLFSVLLVVFICAQNTNAQGTSLQAEVSRRPDGRVSVTLKNTHTADARAFVVECDYPGPTGKTSHWMIAHDGLDGPPFTVGAGKSEVIRCPLDTSDAEVKAVAYDDGKTEGDSQFLAKIAVERKLEAQDVVEDIQILDKAISSLDSSSDMQLVRDLKMQFLQRAQQHANTELDATMQDWVCSDVARMLGSPARKQPIKISIQGYIKELQKLAAILPKPTQTSTSSGTN